MACDSRAPLLGYGRDVAAARGRVPRPDRIRRLADAAPALVDRCLADFRPDVLRIAHEASFPMTRLAALDLSAVRRVLLPFASREQEERLRKGYTRVLAHAGFAECEDRADSGSLQFDRTP
jgi:hypothetical protein